jgi:lipoate-protein ligase A
MAVFEKLQLWVDPLPRTGPEAMAIDEWLLESATCPVLRVYGWEGDWASLGYFGKIAEVRASLPELKVVRRWTGGGLVDHRGDWTYTIVAPQGESLAQARGAESYRRIHEKLLLSLHHEGVEGVMSQGDESTGHSLCFENPVGHDLVAPGGRKLAGAGQRRTKWGLLHQGSVAISCDSMEASARRADDLAAGLSSKLEPFTTRPDPHDLEMRTSRRYNRVEWMDRR